MLSYPISLNSPLSYRSQGPNYEVTDGAFSDWTVSPLDNQFIESKSLYDGFTDLFSNHTGTTLLRTTDVPTTSLVRYPRCGDGIGPTEYSAVDYESCANQTTFADFYWCLEHDSTRGVHSNTHFWVGSADSDEYGFGCPLFSPPNLTISGVRQGDYIDKTTSPNDPIFWLHHAFVDMLTMDFMSRNAVDADHFWSFKASDENGTAPHVDGTFLEDVANSVWPFQGSNVLDQRSPNQPSGPLKYWEAMCWVGPETAIYTYDVFDNVVCEQDPLESDGDASLASPSLFSAAFVLSLSLLQIAGMLA